jgi:hypothetical protein
VKIDIGSLVPLAVLLVPALYIMDSFHPERTEARRQEARERTEIRRAFADKSQVIVIDMRG